jgi:hypothetical protein
MPPWQWTVAVNSAKAMAPFQDELRRLKRILTPSRMGEKYDTQVVKGSLEQIAAIEAQGVPVKGARVLEIGTGWYPVAALIYRAAGARHVTLTDAHRLLHPRTLAATMEFVRGQADRLSAALNVPAAEIRAGLDPPPNLGLEATLEWLELSYEAPYDVNRGPEIDIAFSHTVLEHIAPEDLATLFGDLRGKLSPGGIMCHGIDHSDHRANLDPRLSKIDFLRYSDAVWRYFCINPQDYTNRLRHPDYVKLLSDTGFELRHEDRALSADVEANLPSAPLWGRFAAMDRRDLATMWSLLVASPA